MKTLRFILVLLLPIQLFVYSFALANGKMVELFYSKGYYHSISDGLKSFSSYFSFAFGQVVLLLLIAWLCFLLFLLFKNWWRKKNRLSGTIRFFGQLLAFASLLLFFFMIMWGANYHRLPLSTLRQIETDSIRAEELFATTCTVLQQTNELAHKRSNTDSGKTLRNYIERSSLGFEALDDIVPELKNEHPLIKQVWFPKMMSSFGISGIYFPFTGEANINQDIPKPTLPYTICHELAHQTGFGPESEANHIAYLTGICHPDVDFQYSASLNALRYLMRAVRATDSLQFEEYYIEIDSLVLKDLNEIKLYWKEFQSPLKDFSHSTNDLFLKANRQKEGIKSYGHVVDLLVGEYRKNGLDFESIKHQDNGF